MKKERSKALIISAILGIAYSIYLIFYFSDAAGQDIGGALAATIVLPHMMCTAIAAIFNVISAITSIRGLALTTGILYSVAAVLFIVYGFFVMPMIILSFIGFVKLKNLNKVQCISEERSAL